MKFDELKLMRMWGGLLVPVVLAGVVPAIVMVRIMPTTAVIQWADSFFLGSEINQVGMAGVPGRRVRLVQALRGTMYVHPRRGLVREYCFFCYCRSRNTKKKPFSGQK